MGLDHLKSRSFPTILRFYKTRTTAGSQAALEASRAPARRQAEKGQVPPVEGAGPDPATSLIPGGRSDTGPTSAPPRPRPPARHRPVVRQFGARARPGGVAPRAGQWRGAAGEAAGRTPPLAATPPPRRALRAPRLRIGRKGFIFKRNLLSLVAEGDACQRDVALLLGREGGNRGAPAPCTEWPTGSREPAAIRGSPCDSGVAG